MDASLRYDVDRKEPEINTLMDFSDSEGILRAAEKCNGSGDCRKTHKVNGAMCPSYHATKNERDTTRGRANALREFLTSSDKKNRFDQKELKEVFDLCLSCKACASRMSQQCGHCRPESGVFISVPGNERVCPAQQIVRPQYPAQSYREQGGRSYQCNLHIEIPGGIVKKNHGCGPRKKSSQSI